VPDALAVTLRVVLVAAGSAFVVWTAISAMRSVVLPRAEQVALTSFVFVNMRLFFNLLADRLETYESRDRLMSFYAPVSLMLLPIAWLVCAFIGYEVVFLGVGGFHGGALHRAFAISGSSLLTLGFERPHSAVTEAIAVTESALGVGLLALLITYLPSMYSAFSRREAAVALLEVRAGNPPAGVAMIERYFRIEGLDELERQWATWEQWFAELEESHTSFASLVFFRSPAHHRSWITAAGAVLDAASLATSSVELDRAPRANLCIRAGYVALRSIADFFHIPYNPDPQYGDAISVERAEFDEAYDRMARVGVPLKPDREQAWRDFVGWRVNYDEVLLHLAALTMAPLAPWSSDRSGPYRRPPVIRRAGGRH